MIQKTNKRWRTGYHIQPPYGLLNDPNGLVYHDGVYHVFYQWHPDSPTHGLKYWNHVTSTDLVHWQPDPRILHPDTPYDSHGAYSGSALADAETIHLFYTGNTRDHANIRTPYQIHTTLTETGFSEKEPIISGTPDAYTDHYRDPKVWKEGSEYLMILGAQRNDLTGCTVIYRSLDLKSWEFAYELKTPFDDFGYMWECPDLFELSGIDVLSFCPQGTFNEPKSENNIFPSGYLIGQFDHTSKTFETQSSFERFDHGFDFYAPQTFLDEYGNRILFGWMGLPGSAYPSDPDGWAHILTLPRILSYHEGRVLQQPHPNLKLLRDTQQHFSVHGVHTAPHGATPRYELIAENLSGSFSIALFRNEDEQLTLTYDSHTQLLVLDRSRLIHTFAEEYGLQRSIKIETGVQHIQCFRDTSSIEIFINEGQYVMSARFFPENETGDLHFELDEDDDTELQLYSLRGSHL